MMWIVYGILALAMAEDISTVDRPTNGASASTVGKGAIQIETGLQIDTVQQSMQYSLPTMLRIGLHERFEIRPYASVINYDASLTPLSSSGIQGKATLYAPDTKNMVLGVLASSELDFERGSFNGLLLLDVWKGKWSGWFNTGLSQSYAHDRSTIILMGANYTLPKNQGVFVESTGIVNQETSITLESGYYKTFSQFRVDLYLLKSLTETSQWQFATGLAWRFR
jgi:hypothetical protein